MKLRRISTGIQTIEGMVQNLIHRHQPIGHQFEPYMRKEDPKNPIPKMEYQFNPQIFTNRLMSCAN